MWGKGPSFTLEPEGFQGILEPRMKGREGFGGLLRPHPQHCGARPVAQFIQHQIKGRQSQLLTKGAERIQLLLPNLAEKVQGQVQIRNMRGAHALWKVLALPGSQLAAHAIIRP